MDFGTEKGFSYHFLFFPQSDGDGYLRPNDAVEPGLLMGSNKSVHLSSGYVSYKPSFGHQNLCVREVVTPTTSLIPLGNTYVPFYY